jgi:hypothetical protein
MKTCKKCSNEFEPSKGLVSYCSLKCRNSRTFSEEAKLKKSKANKGNVPWNTGNFSKTIVSKCLYCGNDIVHWVSTTKKYHAECWKQCAGGNRKGSGRGKHGWYKGIWCDSSYELAWVIYQLDHNISFTRNTQSYEYTFNGKQYQYYPDFIQNGKIIEIKGYVNEQTLEKIKSVPNLIVLMRDDLQKEFDYVIRKYGKDFIKLYTSH